MRRNKTDADKLARTQVHKLGRAAAQTKQIIIISAGNKTLQTIDKALVNIAAAQAQAAALTYQEMCNNITRSITERAAQGTANAGAAAGAQNALSHSSSLLQLLLQQQYSSSSHNQTLALQTIARQYLPLHQQLLQQ